MAHYMNISFETPRSVVAANMRPSHMLDTLPELEAELNGGDPLLWVREGRDRVIAQAEPAVIHTEIHDDASPETWLGYVLSSVKAATITADTGRWTFCGSGANFAGAAEITASDESAA